MWKIAVKFLKPVMLGVVTSVVVETIGGFLTDKPKRKTSSKPKQTQQPTWQ